MTNPYHNTKPRGRNRGGWGKRFGRCDPIRRAEKVDYKLRRRRAQIRQHEGDEEAQTQGEIEAIEEE